MEKHRVMVIGNNVTTVQRVSRHCKKKNLEVFPYYGTPTDEEIDLFAPDLLILCLPIAEDFQPQGRCRCILWSEDLMDNQPLPLVTNPTELHTHLEKVLDSLNQPFAYG